MVTALKEYGVNFDWDQKDKETPREALDRFASLGEADRFDMGARFIEPVIGDLRTAVTRVLDDDISTLPTRISGVEILLKTDRDEMILFTFQSIVESLQALTKLVSDSPDIGDLLQ